MATSSSNLSMLINVFTAPKSAFAALKEKPAILFPLLLVTISSALSIAYYFANVDFAWMLDHMVEAQSANKSPEEIEAMRKGMSAMSPKVMGISSIVGALVGAPIIYAIFALYFFLICKIFNSENFTYKSWFALICWTSTPVLFTTLASFINFALAGNGQVAIEAINPISFNSLLLHLTPGDKLFGPVNSWDPFSVWSLVLMVIAFKQWTGKSLANSISIALAPTVLIYGIWIAVALS